MQHTLGDIQNIQSHLQLERPTLKVQDAWTGRLAETVVSDVPDLIYVTGTMAETEHITKNATLHIRHRRGQAFLGDPALIWSISGEKGEIRLTCLSSTTLQISSMADVTIDICDYKTNEIERVPLKWGASELPILSKSYAPIYEAYASGDVGKYADFDHGAKRHKQLDELWVSWDKFNGS